MSAHWTGTEPLPKGETILLEASAGTGKTWQIEALVTRLVAELDVPIERILVITFTNAAAAELRDRIRRRLLAAREALEVDEPPEGDAVLEALWRDEAARGERRSRLANALSSFDQAPISTIHGFCQRMLSELAFESKQEPGLELLDSVASIIEGLVADELALVFDQASAEELTVLAAMRWSKADLTNTARGMAGAVGPVIDPPHDPALPDALAVARRYRSAIEETRAWCESDLGRAARTRLVQRKKHYLTASIERFGKWLAAPSTALKRTELKQLMGLEDGDPYGDRVKALVDLQDGLFPQAQAQFAARVRSAVEAELERTGRLSYDAMLSRLADRIRAERDQPEGGPLAQAIRRRFDAALVDEFQDTDGAQWTVIEGVFAHPTHRLLIIGDPKQAIYSFRGADVHVYLAAARSAATRATMGTNRRSDAAYVAAMNRLWWSGSSAFDLDDVDYVEVDTPPAAHEARIRGLPDEGDRARRAFELRWVDGSTLAADGMHISAKGIGTNLCAELAAREAARLLRSKTEIATKQGWRALEPGDIAVLVRTNHQAKRVRAHLDRLGIPSVSAGRGSVMESAAASWLCTWLDAVASGGRDRPVRALVTTPLFGWSAEQLAASLAALDAPPHQTLSADEEKARDDWEGWIVRVSGWAERYRRDGFVRAFEHALGNCEVIERLLRMPSGERHATDLRHLVELCHAEERRTRLGPAGLAAWLRDARNQVGDGSDETQALRLESDARAVQLVTIHKSKGLEYPVVLLPFSWSDFEPPHQGPFKVHTPEGSSLCLHLGGSEGRKRATARLKQELEREQLRLLYVALTRARHHCVAWLGPIGSRNKTSAGYALGRIALRARGPHGEPMAGDPVTWPTGKGATPEASAAALAEVRRRLDALAHEGTVGWSTEAVPEAMDPHRLDETAGEPLAARPWPERSLWSAWRVSSYSAMVAGRTFDAAEPQRLDEAKTTAAALAGPDVVGDDDEGAQIDLEAPVVPAHLDQPVATTALRGGTEIGTWVHAVLEHLNFESGDAIDGRPAGEVIAELGLRHGVRDTDQHDLLEAALPSMLDTPLHGSGLLAEGFRLRDLSTRARIDELGFDLRLGAGSRYRSGSGATLDRDAAATALRGRLDDDPGWTGRPWLEAVLARNTGLLTRMAGILTGFIDLTFRAPTPDGERYFVCDYKTNRIGPPGRRRDTRRHHYTRPWLDWEMAHHGYHLQSLLYTVALHRLLGQRLADYDYDRHVGGHLYLFLRGMEGAEAARHDGVALGVYPDRWPRAVVEGVDAALRGEATS